MFSMYIEEHILFIIITNRTASDNSIPNIQILIHTQYIYRHKQYKYTFTYKIHATVTQAQNENSTIYSIAFLNVQ